MTEQSRPRQFNGFVIDIHALEKALGIPRDHRIVRVSTTTDDYVPGIKIIIEGPACYLLAGSRAPVAYDDFERWLQNVDEIREAGIDRYGPYEW